MPDEPNSDGFDDGRGLSIATMGSALARWGHWRVSTLASLLGALALVLVGCAGSDVSAEEEFADQVCSSSVPSARYVVEEYEAVRSLRPTAGMDGRKQLLRHALRGKEIAERYGADLREVAVPDTSAGVRAGQIISISVTDAAGIFSEAERSVLRLPKKISLVESRRSSTQLELALLRAHSAIAVPPTQISVLVPELSDAFEQSVACDELSAVSIP